MSSCSFPEEKKIPLVSSKQAFQQRKTASAGREQNVVSEMGSVFACWSDGLGAMKRTEAN